MYSAPNLLTLAALLPLASALILLFLGSRLGRACAYVATGSIVAALGLSLAVLIVWVARPQFNQARYAEAVSYRWLPVTDPPQIRIPEGLNPLEGTLARDLENQRRSLGLHIGVLVDSLTITMFLAISMIATFVHIFSIASLGSDPRYQRFLAYLDLLCFSMFGLALSNNLVQMLAFLQLLAVASWLLIGFSRQRRAPVRAAAKTFIIQSIGIAAFMVGIGTLAAQSSIGLSGLTFFSGGPDLVGTPVLEHQVLVATAGITPLYCTAAPLFLGLGWLTWAGICIFIGTMTMSAQIPLHVWIADAAEGPSPALAMLGSVASVAAGAFVVARLYGILTLDVRLFIAVIGCISLAAGALMAMVQTNLKRILAFSTVSHMGLVMLFFGSGAYVAALLILVVHAFCKSCLFLAAGSVIHSCQGETQLRRMGGLWKRLPITAVTFMLAMLALCGTPWLSGFAGQEMGLDVVRQYAMRLPSVYGPLLWWIPAGSIYLIAIYMWRCWWLVFGGKPRDPALLDAAHENPLMTLVLILLAGLTIAAAYLDIDHIVAKSAPAMAMISSAPHANTLEILEKLFGWSSVIVALALKWFSVWAALIIMLFYIPAFNLADRLRRLPVLNLLYLWLRENMFFDYLYEGVVVRSLILAALLCRLIDRFVIDGVLTLISRAINILATVAGELDNRIFDAPIRQLIMAARFVKQLFRQSAKPPVTEHA